MTKDADAASGALRRRLPLVLVVVGAIALFSGSLRAGFVFDDAHSILRHPGVTGPFSLRAIFLRDFWGEPLGAPTSLGSFRPIATLTFWLDEHLGGRGPAAFHLTNLALFAGLLVAVDRFLATWLEGALRPTARLLVVAAFGALAIHTEVVANATGRAEILALLFSVLALNAALSPPTPLRLAWMALALALAMGSKESAYPLALLAPVLAARRADATRARTLVVGAASIAVLALALFVRAKLVGRFHRDDPQMLFDNPLVYASLPRRVAGGFEVVTHYLEHAATGVDLCPDYGYAGIALSPGLSPRLVLGLLAYAAALFGIVASWRRRPRLAEAIVGFFAAYVAVSQMLIPATVLVADRVFFAPSLFLVVAVGLALEDATRRRARVEPLVALVAAAFVAEQALMTTLTVPAWKSGHALTSYGVRTCPNVIRMRIERIAIARAEHDVEAGAWNALASAALYAQWPRPLADDFLPSEDLPLANRVTALQSTLGPAFDRVRAQAVVLATNLSFPEAARALGGP